MHVDPAVHLEAAALTQLQELDIHGMIAYLLLDLLQADQGIEVTEDVPEAFALVVVGSEGRGTLRPGQLYGGEAGDRLFVDGEGNGSQQAIHEYDVGRVPAALPQVRAGRAPAGGQPDGFLIGGYL